MKPPTRLFDDPEVLPYLCGSLARYADQAVGYDVDKGAQCLAHAIAALPPPDPHSSGDTPTFDMPGAGSLGSRAALTGAKVAWLKVVGTVVIAGAVGAQAYQFGEHFARTTATTAITVTSSSAREQTMRSQQVRSEDLGTSQEDAAHKRDMSQAESPVRAAATEPADSASQGLARPSRSTGTEPAVSARKREITQLGRIRQALPRNPAIARSLAEASLKELPFGSLHQERMGLAVIALFALGESERAKGEAADFLARYPESSLADRIRKLLEDDKR